MEDNKGEFGPAWRVGCSEGKDDCGEKQKVPPTVYVGTDMDIRLKRYVVPVESGVVAVVMTWAVLKTGRE